MVYYLLLQKSQKGLLTGEEQQVIDAELTRRKEAMQSTLDFLSKQQRLKSSIAPPSHSEENSAVTQGRILLEQADWRTPRSRSLGRLLFPQRIRNQVKYQHSQLG